MRVHQVSGERARSWSVDENAHVGAAAVLAGDVRPVEGDPGLHVRRHAEVALEHLRARGGRAELGYAALDEWRSQGDVLRPPDRAVGSREIPDSLENMDGAASGAQPD